ncbi:MAG: hypothetical protein KIT84_30700 [Labilithrix sp.]|nr:hypothetical protein [Labilithrix sp.]MCW5815437.1 hypothetical protein [Labilithrix sp.]
MLSKWLGCLGLLVAAATGCAPETAREEMGDTTSAICGHADDEEDAAAEEEEDADGDLDTASVRIRANVCTPANPRGEEERCANGGFPPRCEVVGPGPSDEERRADACQNARSELILARARARVPATPAQNAAIYKAIKNVDLFCD